MHRFRVSMLHYREAAVRIQTWYRCFLRVRIRYVAVRRAALLVQRRFRAQLEQRRRAALCIQSAWRVHVQVSAFALQKRSALLIQRWFRAKADRIRFLKVIMHLQNKLVLNISLNWPKTRFSKLFF